MSQAQHGHVLVGRLSSDSETKIDHLRWPPRSGTISSLGHNKIAGIDAEQDSTSQAHKLYASAALDGRESGCASLTLDCSASLGLSSLEEDGVSLTRSHEAASSS